MVTLNRIQQGARNFVHNARRFDAAYVAQLYADYAISALLRGTFLRRNVTPPLQHLYEHGQVYDSAVALLREWLPERVEELDDILHEHSALEQVLRARSVTRDLSYLDLYAVSSQSSLLIYAMVRLFRPRTVLETGVANGASTFFILHALDRNGSGELHSLDIADDVADLLTLEERRTNWRLWVLPTHQLDKAFCNTVRQLPPVDLFLHDSDHRYVWQMLEYTAALGHLSADGIIATDDADFSFAFTDFCQRLGRVPLLAMDTRKVFGILPPQRGAAACRNAVQEVVGVPSGAVSA